MSATMVPFRPKVSTITPYLDKKSLNYILRFFARFCILKVYSIIWFSFRRNKLDALIHNIGYPDLVLNDTELSTEIEGVKYFLFGKLQISESHVLVRLRWRWVFRECSKELEWTDNQRNVNVGSGWDGMNDCNLYLNRISISECQQINLDHNPSGG